VGGEQVIVTIAVVTRVRAESNPNAEVVAELPRGTEVEVLSKGEAFVQISAWHPEHGRVSGWVHRNFLANGGELMVALDKPQSADPPCNACGSLRWFHTPIHRHIMLSLLEMVAVRSRICLSCGLVQDCIGAEALADMHSWSRA